MCELKLEISLLSYTEKEFLVTESHIGSQRVRVLTVPQPQQVMQTRMSDKLIVWSSFYLRVGSEFVLK